MRLDNRNANRDWSLKRFRRLVVLRCALLLATLAVVIGTAEANIRQIPGTRVVSKAGTGVASTPVRPPKTGMPRAAVAAAEQWASERPGIELEIAILDRSTGELAENAEAMPMYSASVVKLILAVDILQRRHTGLPVGEEDIRLLQRALHLSDDSAMNVLWDRFDGRGGISRVAGQFGLTNTRPPEDSMWGDTEISARDIMLVYNHVLTAMPPEDRALIMGSLAGPAITAADGFEQAYGLAAKPFADRTVATKPGWMCCHSGEITLHSTGVVGPGDRYVVALLSKQSGSGYEGAREALTEVAGRVLAELR